MIFVEDKMCLYAVNTKVGDLSDVSRRLAVCSEEQSGFSLLL